MSYYGHSFHKYFLGTGLVKTAGHAADLKPGEIGIFNAKTYKAIPLSQAKKAINPEIIIGQGSWHSVDSLTPFLGGMQEPVYSRKINGNYITKFYKDTAEDAKNHIVTLGYDGADTTKTLEAYKNEVYKFRLEIKGNAAQRFLQRENYQDYMVKARCDDSDTRVAENPFWIADQIVEQINNNPYQKEFVRAERIFNCATDPAANPDIEMFDVLEATTCDSGDQLALAAIQNLIPDYKVERVERDGSLSTYRIIVPEGTTAPEITFPANTFVPNCPTCPAGWTATTKTYKFIYRLAQAPPATTPTTPSTVPTLDPAVSAATVVGYQYLGHSNGYSTFYAFLSLPVADVTTAAKASQSLVYTMDEIPVSCISPDEITMTFAEVSQVYKVARQLKTTVNKPCGTAQNDLASIQAYYAGNPDVVPGSVVRATVGECADVFTIKQYNNEYLEDGCATVGAPEYDTLQPYNEFVWEPIAEADVTGTDCVVGVRITAAYEDTKFGKCSWDPSELNDIRPLELYLTHIKDAPECTEIDWPVTDIQIGTQGKGYGETILREYLVFLGYKNESWKCDPRMREVLDFYADIVIDKDKMYDRYVIQHFIPFNAESRLRVNQEVYTLHFILPAGLQNKDLENLLATYAASNGIVLESFA